MVRTLVGDLAGRVGQQVTVYGWVNSLYLHLDAAAPRFRAWLVLGHDGSIAGRIGHEMGRGTPAKHPYAATVCALFSISAQVTAGATAGSRLKTCQVCVKWGRALSSLAAGL
jgi:hypothetical protein